MGGIVDSGVVSDTKTSPRRAAIEKAQAELRQEYDVREERRRELEFLEKGGNPLDFKFGHGASISLQSTSLTEQLVEQYAISEAKGSFALAASPHCDSVESSGRPCGSVGREPNTADNLLLFDGELNNGLNRQKNSKRSGKRGISAAFEHSSPADGCHKVKESDDSVFFHLGVKSQAYARRNRSKSVRDSSRAGSTDQVHSGNRPSVVPSSHSNSKDAKGLLWETQVDDHVVTSVSNSKPASPNGNVVPKTSPSGEQLDMEVDGIQPHQSSADKIKDGAPESLAEANTSENLQRHDDDNQDAHFVANEILNGTTSLSSDSILKKGAVVGVSLVSPENNEDIQGTGRISGSTVPDKGVVDFQDANRKTYSDDAAIEALRITDANENRELDGCANQDQHLMLRKADSSLDENCRNCPLVEIAHNELNHNWVGENHSIATADGHISGSGQPGSALPNPCSSGAETKDMVVLSVGNNDIKNDGRLSSVDDANLNGEVVAKSQKNQNNLLSDVSNGNKKDHTTTGIMASSCSEPSHADKRKKVSSVTTEPENGAPTYSTLSKKAHEDSILKEARIIEANLKRAGELSVSTIFSEKQKRCHWDYVLEEMMWLANDFMQERLWKTTAASQVCKWIASSGLLKFQEANMHRRQQNVARTLAKAIMHFWHSAERICSSSTISTGIKEQCTSDMSSSLQANGVEAKKCKDIECIKEESSDTSIPLRGYAVRFLEYNSSLSDYPVLPEAPNTPDRIHDSGILEMSWEDHLSEKNLVYAVPSGAMQAYRESMELLWLPDKKHINTMHQEDCEVSVCDSVADVTHGSIYEEDEAETGAYVMPGTFESGLSSKFNKKRNTLRQKSPAGQLYEVGTNLSYETCLESKTGNQPLILNGKRPSSSFNVGSIPTKRVRTAARQRVVSPFSAGVPGCAQATSKTDVSSGDTNSYQDDQSSLHGGPQCRKNLEAESTMDFDRQLPYESSEVSTKSKRKKKPKHLGYKNSLNLMDSGVLVVSGKGYPHDQRLQTDPMVQHEPIARKRLDSPHLESNGNSGLYVHHAAKKPKLLKQLPETSPEAITPITGSVPSPVASQMSNMPNPHKLIRIITNRDRGRKKAMKMVAGQSGSGSPWSAFEDQALVVLVHDMGPNWELVSDAFNSTLLFKYIFRKPKECKDRHKFLMDKSAGDGADSAEDSGSSQPYPSTLPGIPKGSARQLFQRLQGPLEEDALKMHFEKIILLGQQLHSCRNQNDGRELKQIVQAHGSHVITLSQVIPNNLNGSILTPLDLCDAITSSPDVAALGYQGSSTCGLAIPSHQSSMAPVLPNSSANAILQGSPGMVLGSGLTSPSTPLGSASRDGPRYGASRPTSFPSDDQQRMQHYNPMLSSRNVQQSGLSVPGALPVGVDRGGVRMLPGGNGMGMMCGMNRVMPMPRPNFQGISSPGMLNMVSTGNMLSCNSVGIGNQVSVHPAAVSGAGNLMLRPRDALHMLRPGQPTEDHRQMPMQELPMQGSQGNCQSVSPFNGMSGSFSNATVSPVQTFPAHQHQQSSQMPQQPHHLGNHPHIQGSNHSSPQQPAYAIRFSKERQLQQRILPQPQPSFSGSSAISPMQGTHNQQQTQSSSPVTPSAQAQHKHQPMPRNQQAGCGVPNQMKQRQRPQVQQQPRNPQQQRQQPQQQAKLVKGLGRGTMLMHQNLPVDASHANGLPSASKNQVSEKHVMQQGQVLYSGNSGLTPSLLQPSGQQKIYARPVPQSSKPMSPMPSQSDSCNQGQIQVPGSHTLLATQQPFSQPSISLAAQQPQQHQTNHSPQSIQKVALPQSRQMSSDGKVQSSTNPVQVNQITPATSIAQCTDLSSAPVASSSTQWKSEPSCDPSTPILSTHMASSPQENLAADEAVVVPTSQASLSQRHFSGALLINGHGIGGQWQQQQQLQSQQLEQPQHQHRQAAQSNSFVHPSDSGQDNKG